MQNATRTYSTNQCKPFSQAILSIQSNNKCNRFLLMAYKNVFIALVPISISVYLQTIIFVFKLVLNAHKFSEFPPWNY